MLYRAELICALPQERTMSDIGVKLHGAIMNIIPRDYAEELHHNKYQPFSLGCIYESDTRLRVRIAALTDKAFAICRIAAEKKQLEIYGAKPLIIERAEFFPPIFAAGAAELIPQDSFRILLHTPCMIKRAGKAATPPDLGAYYRTAAEKLCFFENITLPCEEICSEITALSQKSYLYKTEKYNVSGHIYTGITGFSDIHTTDKQVKAVLAYGLYSGIGAKTAMGMGMTGIEKGDVKYG